LVTKIAVAMNDVVAMVPLGPCQSVGGLEDHGEEAAWAFGRALGV
jgi:hypothetical protein